MKKDGVEAIGALENHTETKSVLNKTNLAVLYTLISVTVSTYYYTQVPELRSAELQGILTPFEERALHYFLNYIGNHVATFNWMMLGVIIDSAITIIQTKIDQHSDLAKAISIAQIIIPYVVLTLLFIANVDTEYLQLLPVSFGSPHLYDIPAGVFGMLSGALLLEEYRSKVLSRIHSK